MFHASAVGFASTADVGRAKEDSHPDFASFREFGIDIWASLLHPGGACNYKNTASTQRRSEQRSEY